MVENKEIERLQGEILQLKQQLKEQEQLINDISVPIIPSIIPETILVPITGKLSMTRLELIIDKIIKESYRLSVSEDISSVIIDFTAISKKEIDEIDTFGFYIGNLIDALGLMGKRALFVGFNPDVTQKLIQSGLSVTKQLNSFATFKTALQFLMKEKGMGFEMM
ncbi:STAS domain-containing protein [Bacillus xiapuensis]|uniref:histidine kinase n=1 Tax=Bacillus xiapuensis TaxID=2014075 RepID=UPI000C24C774|nr:histidine kinase [Bacillus xiapuensis]